MDKTPVTAGVAYAPGFARRWQALMLDHLGGAGLAVALPGRQEEAVPLPWLALLPVQRLIKRPSPDLFAPWTPSTATGDARPSVLVLPPGLDLPVGTHPPALGVLRLEPAHPSRMKDGAVEVRLIWDRPGRAPRLAAGASTCLDAPAPLKWATAHMAKAAALPAWTLGRYAREGEAFWDSLPEATASGPCRPGPAAWAGFVARLAAWGLERAWFDLLHRRQWYLALRPGDGDPMAPDFATRPFTPLFPPKGTGWADPFLFEHNGRRWLFAEEIPGQGRGRLCVLEERPGGGFGAARRILEEPFHLSYPQVFAHGGQVWMVPETGAAGQVRLYRCTDFPLRWELDRVLLEGPAADATFLEHGGRWWLFATLKRPGGSSWDELHLFHAPDRFGPYEPHPCNPVVRDVRRARPGGRVFLRGGRLYRPGQDSSGHYGRALAMLEITRLDAQGYAERPVARLEAGLVPGSFCLHAFEAQGGLEIVDGQRFVPIWR
ncbi:hypothetical protein NNJEOMEG_03100 [Fundidesulfovibrio magnetotacticus]|uniref:Glucosamine inositolphosphorylceramide transferase 1 N-terminal domain-containing protein n=1 Tax=Fundidesulfovibrio magnetotacticus TaxID=2730080 RepID=A0A6V8LRZ8_9BACT|nr:hypothetical protein [Fundidesulfovibrio magnetotacticus]GFK95242.1 hypothetical protein NNJEOMEG_03100 [Fundidesulfovibrio magnetotacticus]